MSRSMFMWGLVMVVWASPVAQAEVLWVFKGDLASVNSTNGGISTAEFDETGTDGGITNIQQVNGLVAQFFPRAQADAASHTLQSGAKVNLQLLGGATEHFWWGAKVASVSRATYADTLTVSGDDPALGAGFLRFQWALHGDLMMQAVGGGAYNLGYVVGYELFVLTSGARQTVKLAHSSRSASGVVPQPGDFVDPVFFGAWGPPPLSESRNFNFSGSQATIDVAFQPGTPLDVEFFLLTWVSITADALDPSAGVIDGDSSFHNSSTLTALIVLDENRQPVSVPYTILSDSGLTYPNPEQLPGDFDLDGDVNLDDFMIFTDCFAGPDLPPAGICPVGVDADLDGDNDVDLIDFALFQIAFDG